MLTTVDIPDQLFQEVQSKATQQGVPVAEVIAAALRQALAPAPATFRGRVTLPLHHSAQPGALTSDQIQAAEETSAQREDASHARAM